MSFNYKLISFHDLLQIPAFKLAASVDCKETMERILWEAGLDTKEEYTIEWKLHRALTTNIPQENYCVQGVGRTDKEFIASGFARVEDYVAASSDSSLRRELLGMDGTWGKDSPSGRLPKDVEESVETLEEKKLLDEADLFLLKKGGKSD